MPEVVLNGQAFPLRDEPPKGGRLMLLARAEKRGEQEAMVAYLDFLEAMLHPDHDVRAFEDAVGSMDFKEVGDALRQAAETYNADPTSAGRTSSSPSGDGPPTGARTSRVVSFSKGTVQVSEAS
jgi:hypothetical protein